jgi:hypothetical protein
VGNKNQVGPAMVPAQVIELAGGGMTFDAACQKIFQEFDPAIETGSYNDVTKRRRDRNRNNERSPSRNQQSEHFIPDSAMKGVDGYSRGTAFSYNVYDNQHAGTEHKILTDFAREAAAEGSATPSLGEQIQRAKQRAYEQLKNEAYRRKGDKRKRSRVKDKEGRTEEDKDKLCQAAAECLAKQCADHYAKKDIDKKTPTKPGMGQVGKVKRADRGRGTKSL